MGSSMINHQPRPGRVRWILKKLPLSFVPPFRCVTALALGPCECLDSPLSKSKHRHHHLSSLTIFRHSLEQRQSGPRLRILQCLKISYPVQKAKAYRPNARWKFIFKEYYPAVFPLAIEKENGKPENTCYPGIQRQSCGIDHSSEMKIDQMVPWHAGIKIGCYAVAPYGILFSRETDA